MTKTQRLILLVAILASFVTFLDGSVVSVALPQITKQLGGGLLVQQWVNDAYLITLGTLILAAGSLSDIFGRKKILVTGLIGFLATSLLCALTPDATILIVARGLQGIAGALLVPSSLAMIISAFKDKAQSKAIGRWTSWTGISFFIGPVVGGLLVDLASWRLVFAINFIPIVIALILVSKLDPEMKPLVRKHIDILGIILGALGLGGIVYALIEQSRYAWSNPNIWVSAIAGLLAFLGFLVHEKRTAEPLLPLRLFKVRNFGIGNLSTFFIYAALSLQGFLLVVFLQQVAHYPATLAGLASLPITIIMFFLSSRFGALSGKFGPRLFMGIGPIIGGLGLLYVIRVGIPANYFLNIFPGMVVFGIGLSMTVAPLTSAVLGSIQIDQAGIGSAINNAVSRIAGLIAVAIIGIFAGSNVNLSSFHIGILLSSMLLIIGGIISSIGIQNRYNS